MKLKKTLLLSILCLACLFSVSFAYTTEEQQAYQYAYNYGITTKYPITNSNMGGNLTRIAMAKMLSQYAINVLGKTPNTARQKVFSDVSTTLDLKYDNGVTLAYQLGIMGINMPDSRFRPYDSVTRAEFATALSRLLYGIEDGTDRYYSTHINKLYREGIISNTNPKLQERRGYIMLMLMRSDKNYVPEEIEYPTTHSSNKIDTRGIYTEGCNWTTITMNQYNTYHDMPNNNWINDVKFVNKALQDVRNNGESLVINYITEANRVLNSAGLTKRDQCRYSLLIDELENQLGSIKSYKNENGKVTIGIDFLSYKENITWDDFRAEGGGNWDLVKNTSEKVRYYTLSNNVNLQTFNIDEDGFVHKNNQGNYCAYTSNWNARLNSFCNGEPVYNGVKYPSEGSSYEPERAGHYYNRNEWGSYCVKDHIDMQLETFRFDFEGNIDQINTNYCGGFTESPFVS